LCAASSTDALNAYPFARDYIARKPAALKLLPDRFQNPHVLLEEREALPSQPWTAEEVAELVQFNEAMCNPRGATLARKLSDTATLAVVTGQQPSLFVSPMYVLYKAFTAWAISCELTAQLARPVIPVFWVASDDHDFAELSQCRLPGRGGSENIGKLATRGAGVPKGSPAYDWRLDESRERLIRALDRLIPNGVAKPLTMRAIGDSLAGRATFESAFCKLLARFLGEHAMLFVAPRLAALRRRQVPILRRELEKPLGSNELVQAAGDRMRRAGYDPMIQRSAGVLNAFYMADRVRARLVARDTIHAEDTVNGHTLEGFADAGALILRLAESPERFSPNVVTRPIVQDASLPSICYVGGPGEITYFAQIAPVYARAGAFMSAIVPRAFAVLEGNTDHNHSNPEAEQMLAEVDGLREQFSREVEALRDGSSARHPHLQVAFDKTERTMQFAVDRLRGRIARHFGMGGRPGDSPSDERVLSPLTYCGDRAPEELGSEIARRITRRAAQ
jgi:bacillithiol synthase